MIIMWKKPFVGKKLTHDLGGHERCKDSITAKNVEGLVRVGD
jgi:hypothetical protein